MFLQLCRYTISECLILYLNVCVVQFSTTCYKIFDLKLPSSISILRPPFRDKLAILMVRYNGIIKLLILQNNFNPTILICQNKSYQLQFFKWAKNIRARIQTKNLLPEHDNALPSVLILLKQKQNLLLLTIFIKVCVEQKVT